MNYFNQNARYKGERQDEELLSPIIAGQPEPLWDLATDGMIQTATTPLPTITATSVRTLFPVQRLCPSSINFASNGGTQKEALLTNFDTDYFVGSVHVVVHMNYVNLLCSNNVTAAELSQRFRDVMQATQTDINNGAITANDMRTLAAQRSAIRLLFFTNYNNTALDNFGTTGIGSMTYYFQDWRSSEYRIPTSCP